jgi:hypothetical protein
MKYHAKVIKHFEKPNISHPDFFLQKMSPVLQSRALSFMISL